ncbi:universal stress protein [Pontibacter sp. E15-1]|uniref:universal stress protein n=1 Tax=Pontibacter sp. E15-1 TaxID=2919918 RepID=UPI001F503EE1|nr:universal stress protein [Pontibacter sp. E15-1]MCJ8163251.1 universal stress protein [Pontibacter sp. E15-1]
MCKTENMKRVLVPIQFDKAGSNLLRYAGHLASTLGAELLLLHTLGTEGLTLTQQSQGMQQLRAFGGRLLGESQQSSAAWVPFECVVRPGSLSECVQTVVRDFSVDLVLMETCVLHQEAERNDPNNAASIMELVSCPVMAVPCTATYQKLENLVFATDFTDQEASVLRQIAGFATQAGANLTLVHVYTRAERQNLSSYKAAMRKIEKLLGGEIVSLKLLEEEDQLEGITDFAEKSAASMLILATQDNYLMQRLFSSNYIKTMAYHTRFPILTFRQLKKKPCAGQCASCANKKAEASGVILKLP